MKILNLNTYDIQGGAARATCRLHNGLRATDVDARMLVLYKQSDDPSVFPLFSHLSRLEREWTKFLLRLESLPLYFYPDRQPFAWSTNWVPTPVARTTSSFNPDLIHLHWVSEGFVSVNALPQLGRPLVWSTHDLWVATGGCHQPDDCTRYQRACGMCPQLGSNRQYDLSRWNLNRKKRLWSQLDLTIVALSNWMAECIQSSALFRNTRVEVISNGLDIHRYRPIDRLLARKLLNLPIDKKLILFGAINSTSNPRKGFQLLQVALRHLVDTGRLGDAALIIFGASAPADPPALGMPAYYQGFLHDDISLALLYSAADVMIVPSKQEAFGQTATEAMACGTPVVAFGATGLLDIVEHRQTGYLAQAYEAEDLARGIAWILEDDDRRDKLAHQARQRVEAHFTLERQAQRYIDLYTELLDRPSANKGLP